MNKNIFLKILFITVIGQLFLMQNVCAQNKIIQKIEDAVTGKPRPMVDSTKINLSIQIKTLQSYSGKRINSIVIKQQN